MKILLFSMAIVLPLAAHAGQTEAVSIFDQSVGVDTHLTYTDSTYASGPYDYQQVMTEAEYLFGKSYPINFRDGFSNGANGTSPIAYYEEFAQGQPGYSKVKFTALTFNSANPADPQGFAQQLLLAEDVNSVAAGSVPFIEGDNECQNCSWAGDTTGTPQAANDQAAGLVTAVNQYITAGDLPSSTGIVFTTDWPSTSPVDTTNPVTAKLANYDNSHPYPGFGSSPYASLSEGYANGSVTNSFATEFGYPVCGLTGGQACNGASSLGGDQPYVDESVRKRYTLDAIMDANQLGMTKLFFYELQNGYAAGSSNFSPWGLFRYDQFTTAAGNLFNANGAPNTSYVSPTATAIHNLFAILSDTHIGSVKPLSYSTIGLPKDCYGVDSQTTTTCTTKLALEDSAGDYFVVLWAEPKIWNSATDAEVAPPSEHVKLALPASGFSSFRVYDPLKGTFTIGNGAYTSSVTVTVKDHPIVVELMP